MRGIRGMTENAPSRAVELLLSNLLFNIQRLQINLEAHKEVVAESAPQLKEQIAERERSLMAEQTQKFERARIRVLELLQGQRYGELANLLGAILSRSVTEYDLQ